MSQASEHAYENAGKRHPIDGTLTIINSGNEVRFAKDLNHYIIKKPVAKAKGKNQAIALEDITGINMRTTVTR